MKGRANKLQKTNEKRDPKLCRVPSTAEYDQRQQLAIIEGFDCLSESNKPSFPSGFSTYDEQNQYPNY